MSKFKGTINIEEIKKDLEREFPNDSALQQIHMARKIISNEAKSEGLSYIEYVKLLAKRIRKP